MSPELWSECSRLFEEARLLPVAGRVALLASQPDNVRSEVQSLLEVLERSGEFLETAVVTDLEMVAENWTGRRFGSFEAMRLIGEGGMGAVYEGLRVEGGFYQQAAIKILKQALLAPYLAARFRSERQILASLDHPNIAKLLDGGEIEGSPFLVMEFIDGVPITDYVRDGKFNAREAVELVATVCDAVEYAHSRQVIHRDIKPANILVDRHGRPRLLDFGIAKILESDSSGDSRATNTMTGWRMATPRYAAPEQLRCEPSSAATDVFSLGMVLRECVEEKAEPALDRVVSKACAQNPRQRYGSAGEMASDLRRFLTGKKLVAPAPPLGRWKLAALTAMIVLGLVASGALYWWNRYGGGAAAKIDSLAVLPFADRSEAKQQAYFADTFTEDIINALGSTEGLRVAARTSAFAFKGKTGDIREIGRKLNAGVLLEGSVRRDKEHLHVTAQLIRALDGYQLWSKSYDRRPEDILIVQADIASLVTRTLRKQVAAAARPAEPLPNLEAHDLYMLGRYYIWNNNGEGDPTKAVGIFERAVALQPDAAWAYSGLADAYSYLIDEDVAPAAQILPKARAAVERALELDPNSAEAHTARGLVAHELEWDQTRAKREFERAIELNPNYTFGIHWHAHFLEYEGRLDEAAREMQRAIATDPLSHRLNHELAAIIYKQRRYEEALRQIDKAHETGGCPFETLSRAEIYLAQGDIARSLALLRPKLRQKDPNGTELGLLSIAEARAGNLTEARRVLAESQKPTTMFPAPPYMVAMAHYALNEREAGLRALREAIDARSGMLLWLKRAPDFDQMATDPVAKALLYQAGGPSPQ